MENNKKKILMQNKSIVNTSYEVSAIQNRLFYNCLFKAQKEKNGMLCCNISIDDIKSIIPNKNYRTIKAIEEAFNVLKQTTLLFEKTEEGDRIKCDYNLIAGKEYNVDKQEFKIFFADRLYNHILEYEVYAPLNLDIMSRFTSFYGQRLYELLRLWSRTEESKTVQFSLEHLRFIFGVENKYPAYKNFKQRVLGQAIKEINEKGNMTVTFEEVRRGRKIESIIFSVLDHETKTYFNFKNSKNTDNSLKNRKENEEIKEPSSVAAEEGYVNEEASLNKMINYTCIPDTHIFNNLYLDKFTRYCFDNSISFRGDKEFLVLLRETEDVFKTIKGIDIVNSKPNYQYFLGIFKNKYEDLNRKYEMEIGNYAKDISRTEHDENNEW